MKEATLCLFSDKFDFPLVQYYYLDFTSGLRGSVYQQQVHHTLTNKLLPKSEH